MIYVENFVCLCDEGKGCDARVRICGTCGFNSREAERRKNIPLTECGDGLRRKIIKREVYRR